jgi:hypothetical protein
LNYFGFFGDPVGAVPSVPLPWPVVPERDGIPFVWVALVSAGLLAVPELGALLPDVAELLPPAAPVLLLPSEVPEGVLPPVPPVAPLPPAVSVVTFSELEPVSIDDDPDGWLTLLFPHEKRAILTMAKKRSFFIIFLYGFKYYYLHSILLPPMKTLMLNICFL